MKCKMTANQVLKRFSRQIRKEDASIASPPGSGFAGSPAAATCAAAGPRGRSAALRRPPQNIPAHGRLVDSFLKGLKLSRISHFLQTGERAMLVQRSV